MTNDHSNYEVVKLDMNLPASVRLITRKSFRNVTSHWHRAWKSISTWMGRLIFILMERRSAAVPAVSA